MSVRPTNSAAPSSAARNGGAALGIIVFLVGIALLGYVFYTARVLFDTPPPTIPTPPPAPLTDTGAASSATSNGPSVVSVIGPPLIGFFQKLFVLLLMCIAGSFIASRGIELFFKTLAAGAAAVSVPAPVSNTAD